MAQAQLTPKQTNKQLLYAIMQLGKNEVTLCKLTEKDFQDLLLSLKGKVQP